MYSSKKMNLYFHCTSVQQAIVKTRMTNLYFHFCAAGYCKNKNDKFVLPLLYSRLLKNKNDKFVLPLVYYYKG